MSLPLHQQRGQRSKLHRSIGLMSDQTFSKTVLAWPAAFRVVFVSAVRRRPPWRDQSDFLHNESRTRA